MNFGNTISFNIFHSVHSGSELEDDDNSDTINSHVPSENDRDDVESCFSPDNSDLELNHDQQKQIQQKHFKNLVKSFY